MANVINKALDLLKLSYDEDDDYDENSYESPEEDKKVSAEEIPAPAVKEPAGNQNSGFFGKAKKEKEEKPVPAPVRTEKAPARSGVSVVKGGNRRMESEIVSVRPKDDSAKLEIADMLLSGKTVLINMEVLDLECAQRIVDFTAGVCYAIKGDMRFPSKYLVVAVPDEVELSGSYEDSTSK